MERDDEIRRLRRALRDLVALSAIPAIIVLLLAQRYIVRGLTLGAVKG